MPPRNTPSDCSWALGFLEATRVTCGTTCILYSSLRVLVVRVVFPTTAECYLVENRTKSGLRPLNIHRSGAFVQL